MRTCPRWTISSPAAAAQLKRLVCLGAALATFAMVGCRPSPDDAAGQAKELEDPVRRQHALVNLRRLYSQALAAQKGDRQTAEVKAVADAAAAQPAWAATSMKERSAIVER
ncbi:MAG: hypothetical protein ACPGUV_03150, partial [Polyangiales bacterium]